jgi:hypothetical protein
MSHLPKKVQELKFICKFNDSATLLKEKFRIINEKFESHIEKLQKMLKLSMKISCNHEPFDIKILKLRIICKFISPTTYLRKNLE